MSNNYNDLSSQQGASQTRTVGQSSSGGRYVPPHLRNSQRAEAPAASNNAPPRSSRDDRDSRYGGDSRDAPRGRWNEPTTDARLSGFDHRRGGDDRGGHVQQRDAPRWADSRDRDRPRGGGGFGGNRSFDNRGGGRGGNWDSGRNQRGRKPPTMERNPRIERALFGERKEGESTSGIDFDRYNDIPVDVSGENIPQPIEQFSEGKFHEVLASNIEISGYANPTPVQKYAIPISQSGRDLMGCAQTGSGKTAAFLFPMLSLLLSEEERFPLNPRRGVFYPSGLVLAPTRELATQIHAEACKFTYRTGIRAVVVYGGQQIGQQLRELEKGVDVIVATPGRLVDMLERNRVSLSMIQFLIFDEADRMLDMGFEPQIRQILEQYDMTGNGHNSGDVRRQTSMFSATFPKEIQRLAADFLVDYIFLAVGRVGSATENITQQVMYTDEHDKNSALMKILPDCEGLTLIFVETKRAATNLEYWLLDNGISATSIHGDRTQDQREEALYRFRKGHCPVLVATSVAARGLDIPNVLMVINYDLPSNIDDYVHRIGRTGRAGHRGTAIAFVNENARILREVYELMKESKQDIEPWFTKMVSQYSSFRGGGGRKPKGGPRYGGRDFRRDGGGGGGGFQHRQSGFGGGNRSGGGGWGSSGGGGGYSGGGGGWD